MKSMYDYNRFDLLNSPQLIRFRKAARIRVRTPRLLLVKLKVINKRNLQRGDNATTTTRRNRKWVEYGNLLPTRIGLVLCSTKAVAELANSGARKINHVAHRLIRAVTTRPPGDHQVAEDQTVLDSTRSSKEILGIKGETKSKENLFSRISGMFIRIKKRTGFSFRKWKISRKSSCIKIRSRHIPRGYMQIHSPNKFMKKKKVRKPEEEEEEEEIELCKKRILMGEKCKPLNISGSLHYDQNGVLLPELLLPCE